MEATLIKYEVKESLFFPLFKLVILFKSTSFIVADFSVSWKKKKQQNQYINTIRRLRKCIYTLSITKLTHEYI